MYEEFLETILTYIKALNEAETQIQKLDKEHLRPGLDRIRVMFEGELVGWLVDEIGGTWSYVEEPTKPPPGSSKSESDTRTNPVTGVQWTPTDLKRVDL